MVRTVTAVLVAPELLKRLHAGSTQCRGQRCHESCPKDDAAGTADRQRIVGGNADKHTFEQNRRWNRNEQPGRDARDSDLASVSDDRAAGPYRIGPERHSDADLLSSQRQHVWEKPMDADGSDGQAEQARCAGTVLLLGCGLQNLQSRYAVATRRKVCLRKGFRMSGTEIAGRDWVEAASCTWLHEALLLVSVLEAACIPAAIPNQHFLGVVPLYAELVGGIRVLVPPHDLARAKEAISSATVALEPLDVS